MLVFRMKIRTLNEFPCFYIQCFCDCKIVIVILRQYRVECNPSKKKNIYAKLEKLVFIL